MTFLNCHVTTGSKCYVTFWVVLPHPESASYQLSGPWALWKWRYNDFDLPCNHVIDASLDFVDGVPSSQVTTLLNLESIDLLKVEIYRFCLSRNHDIGPCLFWWGSLILSHHSAKFGVHGNWK